MQIGVVFPQTEIGADPAGVRAYAQAVQQLGFQHLMVYDHVLGADPAGYPGWSGPYTHESLFHEPMVLFGYLAAVAPGLELVTGGHHPAPAPDRAGRQASRRSRRADRRQAAPGRRHRLERGRIRRPGDGFSQSRPPLRRADRAHAAAVDRAGRHLRGQVPPRHRRRYQPACPSSARSRSGSAARPKRRSNARPKWPTASFRSDRSKAAGRRRWTRSAAGSSAAGRDPAKFGIDARVNASSGTPDDWHTGAEEWRAIGRDAPVGQHDERRPASAPTRTSSACARRSTRSSPDRARHALLARRTTWPTSPAEQVHGHDRGQGVGFEHAAQHAHGRQQLLERRDNRLGDRQHGHGEHRRRASAARARPKKRNASRAASNSAARSASDETSRAGPGASARRIAGAPRPDAAVRSRRGAETARWRRPARSRPRAPRPRRRSVACWRG